MKHHALFATMLAVWCSFPLNLLALDQQTINERTEQLRKMSEVERDRLNRNIQEFQQLSPSEKQRYRDLHAELLDDRVHLGGLSSLLQTYSVWVQTLTPTQRNELQRETNPALKLALVHRFKEEQDQPNESQDVHPEESVPQANPNFSPKVALSSKDLAAVMAVLVDSVNPQRMKSEFSAPHLGEYVPIIHASVQSSDGAVYRDWPGEGLQQNIIAALGKDSMQTINKAESKRSATIRLMLLGILKQVMESVRFPSSDEKAQIHDQLNPAERERIMNLPKDKMNGFLIRKYFESKGDESFNAFKKIPEYRRQVEDLFLRLEVPLPPRLTRGKPVGGRPHEPKGEGK